MLNRRSFIQSFASAALVANLPISVLPQNSETKGKIQVDALCYDPNITLQTIQNAIEGGLTTAVLDIGIYPREFAAAEKELSKWNEKFKETDTKVLSVIKASDFVRAKNEKKLGILLACQDATILGTSLGNWQANLKLFHSLGLRVLQLTHNARTHWADSYMEKRDGGVSLAGKQLIGEMNRLGMIIDLSHCSPNTLFDAVRMSQKPCAVTHAGCKSLAKTVRNKSDEEIRELGKNGGFFGVYNMTTWLTSQPTANLNTVIDHIDHVVQLIGADKVGFGSDGAVDTLDAPAEVARMARVQKANAGSPSAEWEVKHVRVPELNAPNRLTVLAEGLSKRGYSDNQIEGIVGQNFVKFFKTVCG